MNLARVFLFFTGSSLVFSQEPEVNCKLDALLDFEKLWGSSFEEIDDRIPARFIRTIERERGEFVRKVLRFTKWPATDISARNDMRIFGSITPHDAEVEFQNDKATRLSIIFYEGEDSAEASTLYDVCAEQLGDRFGVGTPESYRYDPTQAIEDRKKRRRKADRRNRDPEPQVVAPPDDRDARKVPVDPDSKAAKNERTEEQLEDDARRASIAALREVTGPIESVGLRWERSDGLLLLDKETHDAKLHTVRLRVVPIDRREELRLEETFYQFGAGFVLQPLDYLLRFPGIWRTTRSEFEAAFKGPDYLGDSSNSYQWLDEEKSRAIFYRRPFVNHYFGLSIFEDIPVEEAIVDFVRGRISAVTISIYNEGDAGPISAR